MDLLGNSTGHHKFHKQLDKVHKEHDKGGSLSSHLNCKTGLHSCLVSCAVQPFEGESPQDGVWALWQQGEPHISIQKHIYWLSIKIVFGIQQVPHVKSPSDLFCMLSEGNRSLSPYCVLSAYPIIQDVQVGLDNL